MIIGITGATGQLGRLVIAKLKTRIPAADIIALARSPEKAADLGVKVREGDYDRPDTLERAFAGIDTLLLISSNVEGKRVEHHAAAIAAAKKAGVKRIVYTSLLHADTSTIGLAKDHHETEQALKSSGIAYTILRNGWYAENYTGSIPGALKGGALLGSAGEGKLSLATRNDLADAAAAALAGDGHAGKVYELGGDVAYTLSDLAAEVSRQAGRTIPYKNLPEADYAAALASFGLPQPIAAMLAAWDTSASKGDLFDDSRALSRLIGRPTTPLSTAVSEALQTSGQ
jgi:NAD(P)H dehydrogenase (quinone)